MAATRRHYMPAATITDLVVGTLTVETGAAGWLQDQLDAIGVTLEDLENFKASAEQDITDLWSEKLDAIINGETIIIGGYINTVFIEAQTIAATKLVLTDINALSLMNGPAQAGADRTEYNTAKDILNLPDTPTGQGLFATTQYLGYYDNGIWNAYIGANGNVFFGSSIATNGFYWDGSTVRISTSDPDGLIIRSGGGLAIKSGGGISLEGGGSLILDGGQIKNNADPTSSGGVIIDPAFIRAYTATGLKTLDVSFDGASSGSFYAGDYNNGNEGIYYNHATGVLNIRGRMELTNPAPAGPDPVTQEELDVLWLTLGDMAHEDAVELAKLGTTIVDGGYLQTIMIDANLITTGELDASVVDVTNLNASNIVTGTLDASLITVTNLNADSITAGSIDVGLINGLTHEQLAANAVSKTTVISETSGFPSLSTSYVTVYTGNITIDAAGHIYANIFVQAEVNGFLTEDLYARLRIGTTVIAECYFPYFESTEPAILSSKVLCGGLALSAGTYAVNVQMKSTLGSASAGPSVITGIAQGIIR